MKKFIPEFIRRGLMACGFGPIVLAVIYLILQNKDVVQTLTVREVCVGILSITALAFVAGGMNVLYQLERLPLMAAVLIHGSVLYLAYLITYLLNGWLQLGTTPILVFSSIFVLGYLVIWAVIYSVTKSKAEKLNEKIMQTRQSQQK